MKQVALAFFVLLFAVLTGAAKEIKGSVFIVTNGGQVIKLALAEVYVVAPEGMQVADLEVKERSKKITERMKAESAETESEIERINAIENKAERLKALNAAYEKHLKRLEENKLQIYLNHTEPPSKLPRATMADADGIFKVDAPLDSWLFIKASRGEPLEFYRWVVSVKDLVPDGDTVLFSNHNLARVE